MGGFGGTVPEQPSDPDVTDLLLLATPEPSKPSLMDSMRDIAGHDSLDLVVPDKTETPVSAKRKKSTKNNSNNNNSNNNNNKRTPVLLPGVASYLADTTVPLAGQNDGRNNDSNNHNSMNIEMLSDSTDDSGFESGTPGSTTSLLSVESLLMTPNGTVLPPGTTNVPGAIKKRRKKKKTKRKKEEGGSDPDLLGIGNAATKPVPLRRLLAPSPGLTGNGSGPGARPSNNNSFEII